MRALKARVTSPRQDGPLVSLAAQRLVAGLPESGVLHVNGIEADRRYRRPMAAVATTAVTLIAVGEDYWSGGGWHRSRVACQ
jgi:hypothetical protein